MDRGRIWPVFDDAWILHEDAALLAVDKPVAVPTQAADPERADDLVTRLRAHLERRSPGTEAYVGVHQRLDKETSGVLVFARDRAANASLAAQFEGRRIEKRYVAAVTGWPEGRAKAVLRDWLAPEGGRMHVVARSLRDAQEGITRVTVLGRHGDRALLELVLETGRMHQARVQLAHAGAPIAGDALYGGAPAPRLLLHAAEIALDHPITGAPLRIRAPVPPEVDAWVAAGDLGDRIYDDDAALARAFARAAQARYGLAHATEGERKTTAFRLVNEAGDALPGLAVDVYGDHFVAQLYDGDEPDRATWRDPARRERVLDRLFALGPAGIYLKVRPRQANTLVDTRREDLAPRAPVRGAPAEDPLVVHEEGIPFVVRLGDGLSTGIFLDQRANRRRVRETAGGESVVNLFAYTCGFSVAAAVGGAWRTISVDASVAALERGRENMRVAGVLDTAEHHFVAEDAFAWLARAQRGGAAERHDLVVLDPPSYSSTKKRRFVATSDYVELAASAIGILRNGGRLLACVNHRGIGKAKFRRFLFDAARAAGREVAHVRDWPAPSDYPVAVGAESHLKCALVTLAR